VTAEPDVPSLTWTDLAALGWDWSGPFTLELDGEPLHADAILRHLPGRRMAVRARWRGETVFAKLFFAGHGEEARRESACQRALVDADVPTPAIRFEAGYSEGVVLISDWVAGRAGQTALRDEGLALADQLLDCLFRLYAAGQRQLDLHLDNFLYDGARFIVIDAGAVAPLPGGLRYQPAILDNLALFCAQAPLDLRDGLQEKVRVRLHQERIEDRGLAAMVRRRSDRRLQSAMRKWRRESSAVAVRREGGEQWLYQRSLPAAQQESLVAAMRTPDTLPLIKQGSRVSVYGSDAWVIKHYRQGGWKSRLRARFFRTHADISWVMGWTWALLGVPTPRPVMLRRCLNGSAVIAFPRVDGTALSVLMESQRERARRVSPSVECWLMRLGAAGFWHGDTKAQNVLIDDTDRPVFIDLDGAGFSARPGRRRRRAADDLKRFKRNWVQFQEHPPSR
jgi:tRNA A-37 threonylcarbamoyl transferase component Bud32